MEKTRMNELAYLREKTFKLEQENERLTKENGDLRETISVLTRG